MFRKKLCNGFSMALTLKVNTRPKSPLVFLDPKLPLVNKSAKFTVSEGADNSRDPEEQMKENGT